MPLTNEGLLACTIIQAVLAVRAWVFVVATFKQTRNGGEGVLRKGKKKNKKKRGKKKKWIGEEKVCGNATAVGPFRSEQNGQQTCFRAVIKGILMESMGYERNALRNNYTVELNRSRYGLVKEFHIVQGRLFAEVLLLTRKLDSGCETIKKLVLTGDRQTVSVDDIVEGPLMTISCGEILSLIQLRPSPEAT